MVTIIRIKDTKQKTMPVMDAALSGAVENAVMPSMAYPNSFQKDHFVFPCLRSMFSYSTHLVLNPTQPKMPLEKRLYSESERIASTTCRFIRR